MVFGGILGVYVLLIGGIIVADLVYVAGTEGGRREVRELPLTRIPTDAELAELPKERQLYYEELAYHRKAVVHFVWLSIWTSALAAVISLIIAVPTG